MSGFQDDSNPDSSENVQIVPAPSIDDTEDIEGLRARLPCLKLKLKDNHYLTLFSRTEITAGDSMPTGNTLLNAGLVKEETADDQFIRGVTVCDEQYSKMDMIESDIHRDVISLLCGEEAVQLLESHKRIGTMAWLITGGGLTEPGSMPVLHKVVRELFHE